MRSLRQEGDTGETHVVSRERIFLSITFSIMLGLGFMYHEVADVVKTKAPSIDRQIRDEILTGATEEPLSLNTVEKSVTAEQDETIKIAKAISASSPSLDEEDIASFANIVREESEKYGYDWRLILAIIRTESSLNVRARSRKGAIGLMQVMPNTAKWLSPKLGLEYGGLSSLYDPEYNVKLGTHYLHMMHQKFGDIEKAIVAYNRGPTGLMRYLNRRNKLPVGYLGRVMGYYKELKSKPDGYTS